MTIGIIDYGMGNLKSVVNAIEFLDGTCLVSDDVNKLRKCNQLILPGVGAFQEAMVRLRQKKLDQLLIETHKIEKPLLGICLGMQLLFESSEEFGYHEGIGILKGKIVHLDVPLKVPHMGWNRLNIYKKSPLFKELPEEAYVYFVHSYYLETEENSVSGTTYYGKELSIAAQSKNTFALQFHPEKSGEVGLQILRNFMELSQKD